MNPSVHAIIGLHGHRARALAAKERARVGVAGCGPSCGCSACLGRVGAHSGGGGHGGGGHAGHGGGGHRGRFGGFGGPAFGWGGWGWPDYWGETYAGVPDYAPPVMPAQAIGPTYQDLQAACARLGAPDVGPGERAMLINVLAAGGYHFVNGQCVPIV
jgi:hypothetical protein